MTADIYLSRAQLLLDLDHWDEAGEELILALDLEPANPEALALAGLVALRDDRDADARDYAGRLLAAQDTPEAQLRAAALLDTTGDAQAAVDTVWRAVQQAPTNGHAHWLLARIGGNRGLAAVAKQAKAESQRLGSGERDELFWRQWRSLVDEPVAPTPAVLEARRAEWRPVLVIAAVLIVAVLLLAWLAA